ncbi:right-handed parallel beta-helix repeat-containing protein [Mucilaginibacter agri]|uniref:Right handed beta helix domain-containing protein n=1 Tax=Mucilaginibacter agri TaxID=2695265 RepID=A0A965ZI62_9SPHI|nr:right-handed parallel beta-helix repeat-containing protein [Mucilaginibacter agri]NCD70557.1 hypothetical protein [Mucilaginibacter agri]
MLKSIKYAWWMILLFTNACFLSCTAQSNIPLSREAVPESILGKEKSISFDTEILNTSKSAYDATKALPAKYVTDGSVDYTLYLQNAINQNQNLILPDFPVLINSGGLRIIKSNSTIVFRKNSKLILQANDKPSYTMIAIYNSNSVTIYNANLVGDREKHSGTTGEWGMGITIRNSNNVKLVSPHISNCWGDGIYIAGDNKGSTSHNISIYNSRLEFNRRNGISIISVDSLKILNAILSNNFGTDPEAGLDIEPNSNNDVIDHIELNNICTFNSRFGMIIGLGKLPGQINKNVNVVIANHYDEQSHTAFWLGGFKNSYPGNPLTGRVEIINPIWRNNIRAFKNDTYYDYGPSVQFKNTQVFNKSNSGISANQPDTLLKIKGTFNNNNKVSFH